MNWEYEAIDKLKQYYAKQQSLTNIPAEISRLECAMRSIRSATADGTPVTGGGSGREDMMISNIAHRQELENAMEMAAVWVRTVNGALATLSPEERLILERFYMTPAKGNVNRLCEELGVEKSQVYTKKDAALHHFTIALYGCTEI